MCHMICWNTELGVNSQYIPVSKCFYFHPETVQLCFYMLSCNERKKEDKRKHKFQKTDSTAQAGYLHSNRSQPWPFCNRENNKTDYIEFTFIDLFIFCHKGPVWNHVLIIFESGCGFAHATAITKLLIINLIYTSALIWLMLCFKMQLLIDKKRKQQKFNFFCGAKLCQNLSSLQICTLVGGTLSHIHA